MSVVQGDERKIYELYASTVIKFFLKSTQKCAISEVFMHFGGLYMLSSKILTIESITTIWALAG